MTWRSFCRPGTLLFLALWLILLAGGRSRFFQDPGTFWHTIVGQQILETGRFPDTDSFTFTFAGQPWIPHQWLGECLMALVHRLDGLDSLLLATATILAALFTWLGVRLMRCGLHPSLAAVLVALGVAASSGHFHVRPHLATIVGFAVTMAYLCDFEAKRIRLGRLCWLIPIFWIWSNIHGGALGGLATFAIAIVGWSVAWRIGRSSPISKIQQLLIIVAIWFGCVVTIFINPYGVRLPEAWLDIYRMKSLPLLIQEHAPIDVADPNAWMIMLLGLVYLGLLASTWPKRFRIVWLLTMLWFALACMRIRHAPLFAVGALIALADFFPYTRVALAWQARGSDLFMPLSTASEVSKPRWAGYALPTFVVLIAIALQSARVPMPLIGHGSAKLDPAIWPTDLLADLESLQHLSNRQPRIFNEYAYGGFLIYHTPGYRVFVDDRCELFGDGWLYDFIKAPVNDPVRHLDDWQRQYGNFDYALVRTGNDAGFASYFENHVDWKLVGRSETAALFRRK